MDDETRAALDELKKAGIKLNNNHLREIVELVEEISGRDGFSAREIISGPKIQAAMINQKLNGPQKLDRIKDILLEQRYPTAVKAKKAFADEIRRLKLDVKIKITPTPFFEDNLLAVEFKYRQPDELREIIRSLEKLTKVDVVANALQTAEDYC